MRHVGIACNGGEIEVADLPELIGEHWYMTLCGCAFEDVVSQTESDGGNLTEDYLRRRGWNEPARVRAYIVAMRHSAVSLYEVSDIEVGLGFMAHGSDPRRRSRPGVRTNRYPEPETMGSCFGPHPDDQ